MPNSTQGHPDAQGVLFPTLEEARQSSEDHMNKLIARKKSKKEPNSEESKKRPKKKR